MAGKRIFLIVASRVCRYPVGQKFCRNRSILLRFRDKRVFDNFKGHRKHFSQKNVKLTQFNRQTTYKNENLVYFKKYMVQEP